jgi:SAM-dependent methyltransferase
VDETRRSYDAVAARYAEDLGDELIHKPLDRGLLAAVLELAGDGAVADVGCGPGHVTAQLDGIGFDLSPAMCAIGRRRTGRPFAAADMTRLPVRGGALAAVVSLYAVIHLDAARRARAYAEFARVLRAGGVALVAFHVEDEQTAAGQARVTREFFGHEVELTFHFLDPDAELAALRSAGLELVARLDRAPHPGVEHPSRRCYLMLLRA